MGDVKTLLGSKYSIAEGAEDSDLTQAEFEAKTWKQVGKIGNRGDLGSIADTATYDTMDAPVRQKAKSIVNAGDPDIEVARIPGDAGQELAKTAGASRDNYCHKFEMPDGTVLYTRGIVNGPIYVGGGTADIDRLKFTLGLNQELIEVSA